MADESFEAAVAMLNAPEPAPSAPATDAPTTPAPAPTDAPATETPATEAPTPQVDAGDKLLADLEARRQARQGRQSSPDVVALQAELAELKAKLATPQSVAPDLRALIAEHGEVEGLRRYGIDPLQFFDGFRKRAQAQNPALSKAEQDAAAAKAATEALQAKYEADRKAEQERTAATTKQAVERQYLEMLKQPEAKFDVLHKMDADEALEATYKTIAWLDREGYDRSELTDYQLATLVDRRERDRIRRLTGNDAASATTTPTTVPETDGAKTTPAAKPPASLTNDLASQSTGVRHDMSDAELHRAAVKILEAGHEA